MIMIPTGIFEFVRALHSIILEYKEDQQDTAIFPLIITMAIAFLPVVQMLWRVRIFCAAPS